MGEWSVPIDTLIEEIYEGDIGAAVRDIALQALEGVIFLTPVDTGRLRGAWLVSLGTPSNEIGTLEFGGNDAAAAQFALSAGSLQIANARVGQLIVIENNVEYGIFINDGTDKISPHRMIERTAERLAGE